MSKLDQLRALRQAGAKSSRGGGEKRRPVPALPEKTTSQSRGTGAVQSQHQVAPVRQYEAGVAPCPREAVSRSSPGHHIPMAQAGRGTTATEASPTTRAAAPKRGRPLAKDRDRTFAATKPWEAEGISERTWYRRRAEHA